MQERRGKLLKVELQADEHWAKDVFQLLIVLN